MREETGQGGLSMPASVTLPPLQVTAREKDLVNQASDSSRGPVRSSSQKPHLPYLLSVKQDELRNLMVNTYYPPPFFLSGNINLVTDNKTIFNALVQRTYSSTDDLQRASQITFSCNSRLPLPSALIHCCPWQL